jgi:hypothetical protein
LRENGAEKHRGGSEGVRPQQTRRRAHDPVRPVACQANGSAASCGWRRWERPAATWYESARSQTCAQFCPIDCSRNQRFPSLLGTYSRLHHKEYGSMSSEGIWSRMVFDLTSTMAPLGSGNADPLPMNRNRRFASVLGTYSRSTERGYPRRLRTGMWMCKPS